jgi:hypothetical protein
MIELPLTILLWCLVLILFPTALGIFIGLIIFLLRGKR